VAVGDAACDEDHSIRAREIVDRTAMAKPELV
jgi:hypothetical protein